VVAILDLQLTQRKDNPRNIQAHSDVNWFSSFI
jgi:hypothetical protein